MKGVRGESGWHVVHLPVVDGVAVCDSWDQGPNSSTIRLADDRGGPSLPHAPALTFDGTGYVRIPGKNFRNLRSGTVSVWIRPTAGGYILSSLTDMSNNRQGGPSLMDNGDGTFSVGVGGVSKDNRYVFSVRSDNNFSHNAWHHLVYTSQHGSGTCRLYMDGKLQPMHFWQAGNAVNFFFADLMQSGDDLQLVARHVTEHHVQCGFFEGAMRDLLIFDEPISQGQVAALHAAGPGGDLSQFAWMSRLVAGYRLDEGRGRRPTISPASATMARSDTMYPWSAARRGCPAGPAPVSPTRCKLRTDRLHPHPPTRGRPSIWAAVP